MSLINYEHVGRIKTGGGHLRAAASARTRSKQRKWRVLLSIALLLPALAAIIGIVAWTISIEVANTSGAAHNHHHHHHHQSVPQSSALTIGATGANYRRQQQQVAAAASRALHQSRRQQQQRAADEPPAEAARDPQESVSRPARAEPAVGGAASGRGAGKATLRAPTSRGRGAKGAAAEQAPQQQQQAPAKTTASESGSQEGEEERSSELLLTNLGQVEALNGSQEDSASPKLAATSNEPTGDDAGEPTGSAEPEVMRPATGDSESGQGSEQGREPSAEAASPAPDGEPAERAAQITAADQEQPEARGDSRAPPSRRKSSKADKMSWPGRAKAQLKPAANGNGNRTPTISEESALAAAGGARKESAVSPRAASRSVQAGDMVKKSPQSVKSARASRVMGKASRYTVVSGGQKDGADDNDEPTSASDREQRAPEGEASPPVADGFTNSARRPELSPPAAPFRRPEDEERNRYTQEDTQKEQRDEDLSFEAIASAISTTLSANAQLAADGANTPAPAGGDSGAGSGSMGMIADSEAVTEDSDAQLSGNDGRRSNGPASGGSASTRRRLTPGEHVAEVIDHIVERRKLSSGAISGPQIVVVAPVGGSQLKARSLTKASAAAAPEESKLSLRKPSAALEATKKESLSSGPAKKPARRSGAKPLGGRLLGVGGPTESTGTSSDMKFSERVEVIEDDDSSAFLFREPTESEEESSAESGEREPLSAATISERRDTDEAQSGEQPEASAELSEGQDKSLFTLEQLLQDQPASSHVSNQPGEPRLRSPRHGSSASMAFERYSAQSQEPEAAASESQPQVAERMYSAEKLIAEHLLKTKVASQMAAHQTSEDTRRSSNGPTSDFNPHSQQQQQPKSPQPQPQNQNQNQNSTPSKQVKVAPTTVRPHPNATPSAARDQQSELRQQQQFKDSRQQQPTFSDQLQLGASHPSVGAIQLAPQQTHTNNQAHRYQQSAPPTHDTRPNSYQPQAQPHLSQQQAQPEGQQHQSQQVAPAGGAALPVFADQEYNVPAHMAESVIHNIQMSPLTVSMVNGQPALIGAHQVPHHPSALYQQQQQPLYLPQQQAYLQQQQQQYRSLMGPLAATEQRPIYQLPPANPFQLQQQLQAWQRLAAASSRLHQQQQQQHNLLQRASRSDGESLSPAKSLKPARRGLVNPLAQLALKHLFSSLGKQAASQEQEAASSAQQQQQNMPSISVSLAPQGQDSPTGFMMTQDAPEVAPVDAQQQAGPKSARSVQLDASQQQAANQMGAFQMVAPGSGSSEPNSAASNSNPVVAPASGLQTSAKSAESSPEAAAAAPSVGAGSPVAPRETVDQDMEESYGQMPTYHMAPQMHYGGGGGHYGGGGGDHDKKSKGITFHFGGGPIGGGTQLITSPMGIFKHLMIPLLPNPRVNLNGKVVFGVVLEKSTAIGEPKKKYKFWG